MNIDFDNLSNISDEELIRLARIEEEKGNDGEITQKALKILLNSGYGATASPYFQFFDLRLADSITRSGQCAVRWMEKWLNNFLNKYFKTDNEDYVVTIDTDSVTGDTKIIVNNKEITIEDYYNSLSDNFIRYDDFNNDYVKIVDNGDVALSYKDNNLYNGNINYIMKHKVKKEMFEINVNGKKVIITEDHSIIVERNNTLLSIKPKDIQKNDKLIYIDK